MSQKLTQEQAEREYARIICALDNFQPLSRLEYSEKKDFYIEDQFIQYCQSHNISLQKEAM